MVAQAFAYNGVFFTYALVLGRYYGVASSDVGLYLLPLRRVISSGPLVLGHLFDTLGRRRMITITYGASGVLLAVTGYGVAHAGLSAAAQTASVRGSSPRRPRVPRTRR